MITTRGSAKHIAGSKETSGFGFKLIANNHTQRSDEVQLCEEDPAEFQQNLLQTLALAENSQDQVCPDCCTLLHILLSAKL